ncbi:MAG: ComEA family DNA-binding protein [Saprospiraceae bacterium]
MIYSIKWEFSWKIVRYYATWLSFLIIFCPYFTKIAIAQNETNVNNANIQQQNILEDYLQQTEQEADFDFNTLFESLETYAERPLDLNSATYEDFVDLGLLSDIQINSILDYRRKAGNFLIVFELQAVPEIDLNTARVLQPYVTVRGDLDDYRVSLDEMLTKGRNEVYLRWERVLETQRGYTPLTAGDEAVRYAGNQNRYYARYRYNYENRLSYGITAEKDPGETFFRDDNKFGFDFYSAHFFLRGFNQTFRAIALGDFAVSMGQGLVLNSGFGRGKSAFVTNIKRGGRTLRPYTSVNETSFLRGGAVTFGLGKKVELTTFVSTRRRDANLLAIDTLDTNGNRDAVNFSSLLNAGLHRTSNEIEDENSLKQTTAGASLQYKSRNLRLGLNGLYESFDRELIPNTQLYNQFYFGGNQLLNLSLDYTYIYKNIHFFGETAYSDNGAVATLNGLLLGLDRYVDAVILHRHFPRDYQALSANPFAETVGGRNENGVYLGLQMNPHPEVQIAAYYDTYEHPWLRFRTDAPSRGNDWLVRITHTKKRKSRIFLEVRGEREQQNDRNFEGRIDRLAFTERYQARLFLSRKINKSLELRSRIDGGLIPATGETPQQTGVMFYQDIIYKPIGFPLAFNTRFAVFDAPYDLRFYAYENDLLFAFSVPAYYNRGTRFYLNLRYRGISNMTIEARYEQTYYADQTTFGSGLEQIEGPRRSEVKMQVKYRF